MYPAFDVKDPFASMMRQVNLTQIAISAILAVADERTAQEFYKAMQQAPLGDKGLSEGAAAWAKRVSELRQLSGL